MKVINPQRSKDYFMPTKVYFGRGAILQIIQILKDQKKLNPLFVIGKHTKNTLALNELINTGRLYEKEIRKSDPETINELVLFLKNQNFDSLVAIGGGTIIDTLKSANIVTVNGGIVEDYFLSEKNIVKKGLFLIAVPTTSGTGSEVTSTAVIWAEKKYSLQSEFIFPDVAIVDPALTDNCPPYVTATSGIDALCQAIEAYWNVNHNPTSDKYALIAIEVIIGSLEIAVTKPDTNSRDKMAWGSLNGGLAFSNTQTTICHSISYPISIHWNVSHGQATSITLPLFIKYLSDTLGNRKYAILKAIGANDKKESTEKIEELMKKIGLKTRLSDLGIPKEGLDVIIKECFDPARANNSPKVPTSVELKSLLLSIY